MYNFQSTYFGSAAESPLRSHTDRVHKVVLGREAGRFRPENGWPVFHAITEVYPVERSALDLPSAGKSATLHNLGFLWAYVRLLKPSTTPLSRQT